MSRNHNFYFRQNLKDLDLLVKAHQLSFETLLNDEFSDGELQNFEKLIDSIAAIYVQPILSELSFDDFYSAASEEDKQRSFFESCKSSISLENIPYFESNPFQVSYLLSLLEKFDDVLIDRGGVSELCFKSSYVYELKKHKTFESLISAVAPQPREVKTSRPIDPIDFLVLDVYKEIMRLENSGKTVLLESEKLNRILKIMTHERLDATSLFKKTTMGAKEFDDHLEKLKFTLKKII